VRNAAREEALWRLVEAEGITVKYEALSHVPEKIYGLYLWSKALGPLIILDSSLLHRRRLHKCVLAEEVGHHFTTARSNLLVAHTSYRLEVEMGRDERRALQWATEFLVPNEDLFRAIRKGYRSISELAEYFDVTEWFLHRKLELMPWGWQQPSFRQENRELWRRKTGKTHLHGKGHPYYFTRWKADHHGCNR
jgi:Zn-dependent peptidase ImmA (M78 family)